MMPKVWEVHSPLLGLCAEHNTMTYPKAFGLLRTHFEVTDEEYEERVSN